MYKNPSDQTVNTHTFIITLFFIIFRTLCESSVIPSATASTTTRPSQNVVKIPLKRKVSSSTGTGNATAEAGSIEKPKKKTKLDAEEKENKNLAAKLSWPEQLVRSKAAKVAAAASSRATTTSRHSVDR